MITGEKDARRDPREKSAMEQICVKKKKEKKIRRQRKRVREEADGFIEGKTIARR
jgi:hypothetical protein